MEKAQIEALIKKHRPCTPKTPDEVNTMGTGKNANTNGQKGTEIEKEKPPHKKATKASQIKMSQNKGDEANKGKPDTLLGDPNHQSSNGMYQYQYYMHDPQTEQYGPPCSLCGGFNHSPKHCYKGEHDINNIMEKMSINLHQSQQSNLYQ